MSTTKTGNLSSSLYHKRIAQDLVYSRNQINVCKMDVQMVGEKGTLTAEWIVNHCFFIFMHILLGLAISTPFSIGMHHAKIVIVPMRGKKANDIKEIKSQKRKGTYGCSRGKSLKYLPVNWLDFILVQLAETRNIGED